MSKIGFKIDKVTFVPVSGWFGENLIEKSKEMQWYDGPNLLEAIDGFQVSQFDKLKNKPLRIIV